MNERILRLQSTLEDLSEKEREARRRYYELGDSVQRICADLGLERATFDRLKKHVRATYQAGIE